MPRYVDQKAKLPLLQQILEAETDEQHPLTVSELIDRLAARGIHAERKSLYTDLEQLRQLGADIVSVRGRTTGYYLGQRRFDLPELRLLVDAVQSSRFITQKKSAQLIAKLETLTSRHHAGELQRQVIVSGRVKSMNESIYYAVDALHEAMHRNVAVTFTYFDRDKRKQRRYHRDGRSYTVSPWALTWNDENYYLIGFDHDYAQLRNYRVDRMQGVTPTALPRAGEEAFAAVDMAQYTRSTFGMFGGEIRRVELRCSDRLSSVILDRFGMDTALVADGDGFTAWADVAISPQFYAWATGFGSDLTIIGPADIREGYRQYLAQVLSGYGKENDHDGHTAAAL